MPDLGTLPTPGWNAALDIFVVAILMYQVRVFLEGTRAAQIAAGTVLVVGFFYFSRWAGLETVSWLTTAVLPYFMFAVIVIFQPEIRLALAQFGRTSPFYGMSGVNRAEFYEVIAEAVTTLAKKQIGALIVVQRGIGLKTYIDSGVALDARLSFDLLITLFNRDAPMHDGAVIVQGDRIAAAACFLPLTVKPSLSKELGTRHRAAIGVTEETDAVAIVVSEETGAVAIARNGSVERGLDSNCRMVVMLISGATWREYLLLAPSFRTFPYRLLRINFH
jgi:diadenylate cyclase